MRCCTARLACRLQLTNVRCLRPSPQRAEEFYQSAEALLPLIDRESRPALWVLVSIYHGLLKRIEEANYDVFSRRASVPMPQKLGILIVDLRGWDWRDYLFDKGFSLIDSSQNSQKSVTVIGAGVAGDERGLRPGRGRLPRATG